MDIEQLAERLPSAGQLPGVALLVARDVIESAVIVGRLDEAPAACLRAAGDHLRRAQCESLKRYSLLADQLVRAAETGRLPEAEQLSSIRDALRDLVRAVPAEGSVSPDVEYAGF
jgi:hypothetical protein